MLWAHPVMTVTQSGLGLLVSGSSAQLPRALNRLPESLVVRIKNRMSDNYDARQTGGYRDCLVNVRIKTELTKKLGLDSHVCELQLILKHSWCIERWMGISAMLHAGISAVSRANQQFL